MTQADQAPRGGLVRSVGPGERDLWCACPLRPGDDGFARWVEGERTWLAENHATDGRLFVFAAQGEFLGKYDVPFERLGRWTLWAPSVADVPEACDLFLALLHHIQAEAHRRRIRSVELLLDRFHRQFELARDCLSQAGFRLAEEKAVFALDLAKLAAVAEDRSFTLIPALSLPRAELWALCRAVGMEETLLEELDPGASAARQWLVGVLDQRPVGVALPASAPGAATVHLWYVGLVPQARGRGLGALLLAQTLIRARQTGAASYVGSTKADNAPMLRLFAKLGCEKITDRFVYMA